VTSEVNKLLIRGARVLDLDGDVDEPPVRDILIEGNSIRAIAPRLDASGAEVLGADGMLAVPGFANVHYHSHDALARGMFEDLTLEQWGTLVGVLSVGRSLEEVRLRTLAGAVEMLRNGVTTVQDMCTFSPATDEYTQTILDAYAEAGIRVIFAVALRDVAQLDTLPWMRELAPKALHDIIGTQCDAAAPQMDYVKRQIDRIGERSGMVRWALGPSAPQRCTRELLEAVADLSSRQRLPVYTHVYESRLQRIFCQERLAAHGGSALKFMKATGLLGANVTIAHGIWFDEGELDLIAETGTNVVLNILSNLKLKSGVPPILAYRARKVNVALGSDNCSASDVQSMLQVMKLYCLLAAAGSPEPSGVRAADALHAATVGGARTGGLDGTLGLLKPGYKADVVLVDLADPAYVPLNSALRQLVYSDSGRAIRTVIVDGRIVVRDGAATRLDERALQEEIAARMPALRKDLASVRAGYNKLQPYFDEMQRRASAAPLPFDRLVR
jgi:5-methylthioadenosine/S-adenosylhomocysteine deaminase